MQGRYSAPHRWAGKDSNLRATDYESAALTPELPARHGSRLRVDAAWATDAGLVAADASAGFDGSGGGGAGRVGRAA